MANIKSAKKRIRVIENKTAQNKRVKNRIKDLTKEYDELVLSKNKDEANTKLILIEKKLAQATKKGVYHKNTCKRKISRLRLNFNKVFPA